MSPVPCFVLESCPRNSGGAVMWVRSTLSNRNKFVSSSGNGTDRGAGLGNRSGN